MDRTYKNLVFTKHALERTSGRVLTQDAIYQTVTAPIENHQWLVVSAWVRGEEDRESLVWQLLSLPFKLTWRGLLVIWKYFKKRI